MSDPYYRTSAWQRLRLLCLKRDNYRCAVPGCRSKASVADHIKSRRQGGTDTLDNLRSLCDQHDRQVKETAKGQRRNGGSTFVPGCDAQGRPLDPSHPWHTRQAH